MSRTNAVSRPPIEGMALPSLAKYVSLADAIADATSRNRDVPCLRHRRLYNNPRPDPVKERMCRRCPALKQCQTYTSSTRVHGYRPDTDLDPA